jgi:hypothetical protein
MRAWKATRTAKTFWRECMSSGVSRVALAFRVAPLRSSSQTRQRINGAGVELPAHEKARARAAPSAREAKSAVIVHPTLIGRERDAAQVLTHRETERQSRIEAEVMVRNLDCCEPEPNLEAEEARARLGEEGLSYHCRSGWLDGQDPRS